MKSIIFIGTNKSGSSREAIKAAERLGFYTILLTNNSKLLKQREEFPDVHLIKLCNIDNFENLVNIITNFSSENIKVKAIVSFVDGYCYMANILAKHFGLNHFTCEAIKIMENKLLSRNALKDTKYVPKFLTLIKNKKYELEELKDYFPAVLKSSVSTGSRDVYLVNNIDEFNIYYEKLINLKKNQEIILEEYLDGPQLIVEVVIKNQVPIIVAVIEQEISYINKHFIVTGYYLQLDKQDYFDELNNSVKDIIDLHGIINGVCHLELRNINGTFKLIEINPRISGGGMNHLILFGTGVNLVEETLKLLLNQEIDLNHKFKKYVYLKHTTAKEEGILERVTGKQKTLELDYVNHLYIKPRKEKKLILPESMGDRYAYVITTGNDMQDAKNKASTAINIIKFHLKNK